MRVFFVQFSCHIGDIHLNISSEDISIAKKLNVHEIELSDTSAIYIGTKKETDTLINLLESNESIIKTIQEMNMIKLESEFNLTDIDEKFLIDFLIENSELNDYLDKINKLGINSISNIELKTMELLSNQ